MHMSLQLDAKRRSLHAKKEVVLRKAVASVIVLCLLVQCLKTRVGLESIDFFESGTSPRCPREHHPFMRW